MIEEWKDIPGYKGYYQVSNLGQVRSLDREIPHKKYGTQKRKGKILSNRKSNNGYYHVMLINKNHRVNKLVYETFVGKVKEGNVVDHINNNERQNNSLQNLQEITHRENLSKDKKTNLTGAYKDKRCNSYYSKIRIGDKQIYLGSFDTEEKAHQAYINKLKELQHI